jgi:hypothetical protein
MRKTILTKKIMEKHNSRGMHHQKSKNEKKILSNSVLLSVLYGICMVNGKCSKNIRKSLIRKQTKIRMVNLDIKNQIMDSE